MLKVCARRSTAFLPRFRRIVRSSTTQNIWAAPIVGYGIGCIWHQSSVPRNSQCSSSALVPAEAPPFGLVQPNMRSESVWKKVRRGLRMLRRLFKLMAMFSPILMLYPIASLLMENRGDQESYDAREIVMSTLDGYAELPGGFLGWYYRLCLSCVEWSGAACIKFSQWAGSRPDLFGREFCLVFSRLQDNTTPHARRHTDEVLKLAYGEDWQSRIRLNEIIGSGCIAQVYKGVVLDNHGNEQEVAVKVMHPHVEDDIDTDLDLMRLFVRALEWMPFDVFPGIKWLNMPGIVEELAGMLKIQLDLRQEAEHLERFNKNFAGSSKVIFPKLVEGYAPTRDILFETFCPGVPVLEFAKEHQLDQHLLTQMCHGAIEAVCQMLFIDNFVHGDLHPGNILVSPDNRFVLLDVGICIENSERDHGLISDILAAFIRKKGRRAGGLMIEDSNFRLKGTEEQAVNEELFIQKIEAMTNKAAGPDYLMEHLGSYITTICDAAAAHHVMVNQAFISSALAVKLQEGVALALDPTVEIWRVAIPIILEGERRRGVVAKRATELLGLGNLFGFLTTDDNAERAPR